MKTFGGNRRTADIVRDAKAQGVKVFDKHYKCGGDHITFESSVNEAYARIVYNTFNGRFFGTYCFVDKRAKGGYREIDIDSSSTKHEQAAWFQGLLSFFYVEKPLRGERGMSMVSATLGGIGNAS